MFRSQRRKNPKTGKSYAFIVRTTAMVNYYYFYGVDGDFGPFFLKFCSLFTRVYARALRPALAQLTPVVPVPSSSLRSSFDKLETALDQWCDQAKLAA